MSASIKYCGKCGTAMPSNAAFCPICGKSAASPAAAPKPDVAAGFPVGPAMAAPAAAPGGSAALSGVVIGCAAGAFVVVAAALVIAYLVLGGTAPVGLPLGITPTATARATPTVAPTLTSAPIASPVVLVVTATPAAPPTATQAPAASPTATSAAGRLSTPTPTPPDLGWLLRGRVRLADGSGLAGARIMFYYIKGNNNAYATSGPDGSYLGESRWTPGTEQITVWAELAGYTFDPPQFSWTHAPGYEERVVDFVAKPGAAGSGIPASATGALTLVQSQVATLKGVRFTYRNENYGYLYTGGGWMLPPDRSEVTLTSGQETWSERIIGAASWTQKTAGGSWTSTGRESDLIGNYALLLRLVAYAVTPTLAAAEPINGQAVQALSFKTTHPRPQDWDPIVSLLTGSGVIYLRQSDGLPVRLVYNLEFWHPYSRFNMPLKVTLDFSDWNASLPAILPPQ
jgi:hypothetical protein